ncbi:MAG: hypothetical protein HGB21_13810, partial [Nitrospirae bacterium]|nr:hypothetical protein [Nitrospirota bacterium]
MLESRCHDVRGEIAGKRAFKERAFLDNGFLRFFLLHFKIPENFLRGLYISALDRKVELRSWSGIHCLAPGSGLPVFKIFVDLFRALVISPLHSAVECLRCLGIGLLHILEGAAGKGLGSTGWGGSGGGTSWGVVEERSCDPCVDEIIKQLNAGADFAKLAEKDSKDSSAKQGGDLGWFSLQTMVKPFADAVAALQVGKFTETPVQSEFGYHVILLEEV